MGGGDARRDSRRGWVGGGHGGECTVGCVVQGGAS